MEMSSLRTLKIMPRKLYEIVRSWFRLLVTLVAREYLTSLGARLPPAPEPAAPSSKEAKPEARPAADAAESAAADEVIIVLYIGSVGDPWLFGADPYLWLMDPTSFLSDFSNLTTGTLSAVLKILSFAKVLC
jgi:hypothetical protein